MSIFSFERLEVFQCATEFLLVAAHIVDSLPRGFGALGDQLKRASLSVTCNIAEGTGRLSAADQRRFYGIARGSAMECAALMVACTKLGLASDAGVGNGRRLLVRIVSMLTKMCRP
jgi:four helix bundle protein